jgi:hypothetical protein
MNNLTDYEYDVLLSHNYADATWTEELAARLEREKLGRKPLKVFYSERDIRPGQSIPQRMQDALTISRKVVLILSPQALGSRWVELEYLATLYAEVSKRQEHLIPLMHRDCEVPYLIAPLRYIDFRKDQDFDRAYRELLAVIKDEPLPRLVEAVVECGRVAIPRPPVVGFVARRDDDGRDIVERLKDDLPRENQFIALSGPGGVGKTTLAAEATRALSETFGNRIVWAGALGREDFSLYTLLDEIATQLGQPILRILAPQVKAEQVQALIATEALLIVLDNFETINQSEQKACA